MRQDSRRWPKDEPPGRSSWLQPGCCGHLRSESADQRSLPPSPRSAFQIHEFWKKKKTSKTKISHHPLRSHPQSHQDAQPEATCISHTRNVDLTRLSPPQTRAQVTLTGRPLHRLRPLCLRPVTWASFPDTGCHHTRAPPANTRAGGPRSPGSIYKAPPCCGVDSVTNFYGLRIFSKQGSHDRTSMAGGSSETTRHLKASPKEEGCPLVTAGGGCFRNEPQASSSGPAQTAPLSASESPGQGPRGRGLDTRHRSAPLPKLCEVHLQARICRLFPWAPLLHRQGLHLSGCRTDTGHQSQGFKRMES